LKSEVCRDESYRPRSSLTGEIREWVAVHKISEVNVDPIFCQFPEPPQCGG
jgi:hypothetical protein